MNSFFENPGMLSVSDWYTMYREIEPKRKKGLNKDEKHSKREKRQKKFQKQRAKIDQAQKRHTTVASFCHHFILCICRFSLCCSIIRFFSYLNEHSSPHIHDRMDKKHQRHQLHRNKKPTNKKISKEERHKVGKNRREKTN